MDVIEYCTEEVRRQGHDTTNLDGIERVGWMLDAWSYALTSATKLIFFREIRTVGRKVEPLKNSAGYRNCDVWVGTNKCPSHEDVVRLMGEWVAKQSDRTPLENYRALLEIHPFVDGNGRTGKVILNWLLGSLLDPVFPPNDFWGKPIRNP